MNIKKIDLAKMSKDKTPTSISIDKNARALYFAFNESEVANTKRVNNSLSIDYDKNNEIVGVEIIRVVHMNLILIGGALYGWSTPDAWYAVYTGDIGYTISGINAYSKGSTPTPI